MAIINVSNSFEYSIYVACLASYNNGRLHGAWIDATLGEDHITEQVSAMLASSPEPGAEEWAIHDSCGFGKTKINEYESFAIVCELAEFLEKHGEIGALLLEYDDLEVCREMIENQYIGEYDSVADYCEESISDSGIEIPESIALYIDFELMARDMECGGDIITFRASGGKYHIFSS